MTWLVLLAAVGLAAWGADRDVNRVLGLWKKED